MEELKSQRGGTVEYLRITARGSHHSRAGGAQESIGGGFQKPYTLRRVPVK